MNKWYSSDEENYYDLDPEQCAYDALGYTDEEIVTVYEGELNPRGTPFENEDGYTVYPIVNSRPYASYRFDEAKNYAASTGKSAEHQLEASVAAHPLLAVGLAAGAGLLVGAMSRR